MNVGEATNVNVVAAALLGPLDPADEPVGNDGLVSALASLAERAAEALGAGFNGGIVVAREGRLRNPRTRVQSMLEEAGPGVFVGCPHCLTFQRLEPVRADEDDPLSFASACENCGWQLTLVFTRGTRYGYRVLAGRP